MFLLSIYTFWWLSFSFRISSSSSGSVNIVLITSLCSFSLWVCYVFTLYPLILIHFITPFNDISECLYEFVSKLYKLEIRLSSPSLLETSKIYVISRQIIVNSSHYSSWECPSLVSTKYGIYSSIWPNC